MSVELLVQMDEMAVQLADDIITFLQDRSRQAVTQSKELSDYQSELTERIESLKDFKERKLAELSCKRENLKLVVKCKDCRVWRRNPANSAYGDCGKRVTKENDYCSYGVRKE